MNAANYPDPDLELAGLRELARVLADSGVDLIALEMMEDTRHAARAMEAALETGLPVWLGVSCRQRDSGDGLVSFDLPDMDFSSPLDALIPMGPTVVNIMHSTIDAVPEAVAMVRKRWAGPIGVYPEVWKFNSDLTPDRLVEHARSWAEMGVLLLGGCCGTTPAHIRALALAFG